MRLLLLALLMQLDAPLDDCPELHSTCLESCRVDFGMERERKKLTACVETCEAKQAKCERGKERDLDELQKAREALSVDKSANPAQIQRVGPAPVAETARPVEVTVVREPAAEAAKQATAPAVTTPIPAPTPAPKEAAPAASAAQRKQSIDDAFDQDPAPAAPPAPAKAKPAK